MTEINMEKHITDIGNILLDDAKLMDDIKSQVALITQDKQLTPADIPYFLNVVLMILQNEHLRQITQEDIFDVLSYVILTVLYTTNSFDPALEEDMINMIHTCLKLATMKLNTRKNKYFCC